MPQIMSEAELNRANILMAWSFVDTMTADQFAQLCRVTVEELGRVERSEWAVGSGEWGEEHP